MVSIDINRNPSGSRSFYKELVELISVAHAFIFYLLVVDILTLCCYVMPQIVAFAF